MEILKGNSNNRFWGFEYKGYTFWRTAIKVYKAEEMENRKWRGLGRGGYEYAVFADNKIFTFFSLREVKEFINARKDYMEAKKRMDEVMEGAIVS